LFEQFADSLLLGDDVFVEFAAGFARNTAEHDQQRLACAFRFAQCQLDIVVDPPFVVAEPLPILLDFGRPILAVDHVHARRSRKPSDQKRDDNSCEFGNSTGHQNTSFPCQHCSEWISAPPGWGDPYDRNR
jgi:hypothetical protein